MSMLSSFLGSIGIPKGVQQAATTGIATMFGGPVVGAAVAAAQTASKLPSPFSGAVPPGGNSMINSIFHLGPTSQQPTAAGCPKGYHLNKHALPASRTHGAV